MTLDEIYDTSVDFNDDLKLDIIHTIPSGPNLDLLCVLHTIPSGPNLDLLCVLQSNVAPCSKIMQNA